MKMSRLLKRTPLHSVHVELGANLIDFGGWHLPVRYVGDLKEHHAVRQKVGLFDVSHMGQIWVRGPGALELLQHTTCNDVLLLKDFQIQYSAITTPTGCFIDDILIYRQASDSYFVVVNASNQEKDFKWFQENNTFGAELVFASDDYAQLALQGPLSIDVLKSLTDVPVETIPYYHFVNTHLNQIPVLLSRTGYTASDGYELYVDSKHAIPLWNMLMEAGAHHQIMPCGLGARDSLRIEGKMALYGNDIDETTSVLEANLGWIIKWNKGSFIGKEALLQQKEQGLTRKLIGFEMLEKGIARHGYPVYQGSNPIGVVTSGVLSPTLGKPIGLAYLQLKESSIGNEFQVEIRGKRFRASVVKTPFYQVTR